MEIEKWIVITNLLVALTSILAAAAAEHDAIKTMGATMSSVIHLLKGNTPNKNEQKDETGREENEV